MHARKNVGSSIGAHQAVVILLYDKALLSSSKAAVDEIVSCYLEAKATFLEKFETLELFRTYY